MAQRDISLSDAEALVLFEWLARLDESELDVFSNQAEQVVAWRIQSQLESQLPQVFSEQYSELLAQARIEVERTADEAG